MPLLSKGTMAPIGFADESPQFARATYYPTNSIALTKQFVTYGAIYRAQPWVNALVNKVAHAVARLPLKVYTRDDQGRNEARDSPLAQLLRAPNRRHDPFFFWLWTVSTFEVYGESMWVKFRPSPGAAPVELWPMHPANVYTRRDDDNGDLIYTYHIGSAQAPLLEFPSADVVHFRSYNPSDQIRGLSRLEPLRQTVIAEDAQRRGQAAMARNAMRPSVAIQRPADAPEFSDAARERLRADWERLHAGADNWGKAAILEEGMTVVPMQLTAEDMQVVELLKLTREEYCGVFDIPPPVVHILDRATFSNITEQMRSMYRDSMAPRLGLYESAIDTQLRPDFDVRGNSYAEFLMDEVLRGDFEQRAEAWQKLINSAVAQPAEAREKENLPDAGPGSHRLYLNSALVPITPDETAPTDEDAETDLVSDVPTTSALSVDVLRTLMGRLSRVKSLTEIDPDTLADGLNGQRKVVLDTLTKAITDGVSVAELRGRLRSLTEGAVL